MARNIDFSSEMNYFIYKSQKYNDYVFHKLTSKIKNNVISRTHQELNKILITQSMQLLTILIIACSSMMDKLKCLRKSITYISIGLKKKL